MQTRPRCAAAWAVAMHVAILLFPVAIATLPHQNKRLSDRNIAWAVWGIALVLALIGNIAGSVAHASGRTILQVLNGAPTTASGFVQVVAGLGGFLIIALEFASGRLLESNAARLLFGPSPDDIMPADPRETVRVDKPAPSLADGQRTHRLGRGRTHALPDSGRAADGQRAGGGQGQRTASGQAPRGQRTTDSGQPTADGRARRGTRTAHSGQRTAGEGPLVRDMGRVVSGGQGAVRPSADTAARPTTVRPSADKVETATAVRPSADSVVLPAADGLSAAHQAVVEAYAMSGNVRVAAQLLSQRGYRMGKTKLAQLLAEAREINPDWVAAVLGEELEA